MDIIPAIDLLGGKCVRLVQGHYDRVIAYERDPIDVASGFLDQGATRMHVIDLNGARTGQIGNLDVVERLAGLGAIIEFGGGVRDEATIDAALSAGAQRVIIGTRALEDMAWFEATVHQDRYADKIALGLDARLGRVAVDGWTRQIKRTAAEVAVLVRDWPLASICYTDIGRDGMLLGPNLDAIRNLASMSSVPVIACGGVSELDDVRHLARLNLAGVVIGRAIYEEAITVAEAIEAAKSV